LPYLPSGHGGIDEDYGALVEATTHGPLLRAPDRPQTGSPFARTMLLISATGLPFLAGEIVIVI